MNPRIVLLALVALLVGLVFSTGVVVVRQRSALAPDPAPGDSLALGDSALVADTLAADSLAADSTLWSALPDSSTLGALQDLAAADSAALAVALPAPPPADTAGPAAAEAAPADPEGAGDGAETRIQQDRLAKLFAAMPAKDAARVLEQMDDAEIETVLSYLRDRQAAAILGSLPTERAAGIGRSVLAGGRSPQ